jgi:selenide,water dikinase
MEAFSLLPDPQTNGGLLIAVGEDAKEGVVKLLLDNNLDVFTTPVGRFLAKRDKSILVK